MGRQVIINPGIAAKALELKAVAPTGGTKLSKAELESRLRMKRSPKYVQSIALLDAEGHCQDPRAVEALIAAIQHELPEGIIEKLPIGIVSRLHQRASGSI